MIDSSGCWQSVAVASASSCKAVTAQNALWIARLAAVLAVLKPDCFFSLRELLVSFHLPEQQFFVVSFRVTESFAPVERC